MCLCSTSSRKIRAPGAAKALPALKIGTQISYYEDGNDPKTGSKESVACRVVKVYGANDAPTIECGDLVHKAADVVEMRTNETTEKTTLYVENWYRHCTGVKGG